MATITSAQSGLSNAPSTWVGGVVPVVGDKVIIATNHIVEVTGSHVWGDDVSYTETTITTKMNTAAVLVNGTLKASRTVNNSLTVRGTLVVGTTNSTTYGTVDYGRSIAGSGVDDPIPLGVTATLVLNDSAALSIGKHGMDILGFARAWFCGHARVPNALLLANAPVGANFIDVTQATNWQVNDVIGIGTTTDGSYTSNYEEYTINGAITPISGGFRVPITPAKVTRHDATGALSNLTSNVVIQSQSLTQPGWIRNDAIDTSLTGILREWTNVRINSMGHAANTSVNKQMPIGVGFGINTLGLVNPITIKAVIFYMRTFNQVLLTVMTVRPRLFVDDSVVVAHPSATGVYVRNGGVITFNRLHVLLCATAVASDFSQGGQGCIFNDAVFSSCTPFLSASAIVAPTFNRCRGINMSNLVNANAAAAITMNECELGAPLGRVSAAHLAETGPNSFLTLKLNNCRFPPGKLGISRTVNSAVGALEGSMVEIVSGNNDPTYQEIWLRNGSIIRDNAVKLGSRSSIRFTPFIANAPLSYSYKVVVANGVAAKLVFFLRYDANYTNTSPPTITVTPPGGSAIVLTAGSTVETSDKLEANFTPTQNGEAIITVSGQSPNTTGNFWFSGVVQAPFINWQYFYGYKYNPSSSLIEVDPIVQLTESSAAALTGISYASGTLTISEGRTIRQVYDWLKWYETSNNIDPIITSTDGTNFTLAANLTLNATLSGSGVIDMSAYTLAGTADTPMVVQHSGGRKVTIVLTLFSPGTRFEIYNTDDSTSLYNDIPAGRPFSLRVNYTGNKLLRVKAVKPGFLPLRLTGSLTSIGVNFAIQQTVDEVWTVNGIDGSTVTEFAASSGQVHVDVSDADGRTTAQRLYAWYINLLMSATGLANYFEGILAEDSSNYKIDITKLDLKIRNRGTLPTVVTGGRIYRSDHSSPFEFVSGDAPISLDAGRQDAIALEKINAIHDQLTYWTIII